ncbi:LLM class flavin-dependent oxidoreductase [Pseudomonas sp. LRF_L74]|uniref:LLM class flavin-dependent oxidoreductase n=1 Tax=Pseudomonas sp. LRF_L74 TaxID=3369422 RepID=UPI003F5E1DC6
MKFSFFNGFAYKPPGATGWPASPTGDEPGLASKSFERTLQAFDLADELGFDWLSIPEHHFKPFLSTNPLLAASVLSQRGYRARLAILGSLLPGRDPVRVAEEYATLDNLTQGRLVIGLLRGNPIEQVTFGINPQESRARFEEATALILKAWKTPVPFGWEGRFFRQRTLAVWPRLVEPLSAEKVVVSGNTLESVEFAARSQLSIAIGHQTVEDAAVLATHYRQRSAVHGWTPTARHIVYHAELHLADNDAQAEDEIARYKLGLLPNPLAGGNRATRRLREGLGEADGEPFSRVLRFHGGPDTVREALREAQSRIGFGVLNAIFQINRLPHGQQALRSLELFGRELIPSLRNVAEG